LTIQNIKEELNKDKESLREKNQTEIKSPFSQTKNTVEGHSSTLKQVEDRTLEQEDKIEIKKKTEEILAKQLKSCETHIQQLSGSIKRPNLRIMGVEEREEVQAKEIYSMFNK
jgi:chromosome segregation ATPase